MSRGDETDPWSKEKLVFNSDQCVFGYHSTLISQNQSSSAIAEVLGSKATIDDRYPSYEITWQCERLG
jgi:hypothetical protein